MKIVFVDNKYNRVSENQEIYEYKYKRVFVVILKSNFLFFEIYSLKKCSMATNEKQFNFEDNTLIWMWWNKNDFLDNGVSWIMATLTRIEEMNDKREMIKRIKSLEITKSMRKWK